MVFHVCRRSGVVRFPSCSVGSVANGDSAATPILWVLLRWGPKWRRSFPLARAWCVVADLRRGGEDAAGGCAEGGGGGAEGDGGRGGGEIELA